MAGPQRLRRIRVTHRRVEVLRRVCLRIEDRDVVHAVFGRTDHRAVRVDRRITPVRGNQVVEILFLVGPVPGGDHDVALDALRPRRLAVRQLALLDPLGPVGEVFDRRAGELPREDVDHQLAGLAGLRALHPGLGV